MLLQCVLHSSHHFNQKEAQSRRDPGFCALFGKVLMISLSVLQTIDPCQWQRVGDTKGSARGREKLRDIHIFSYDGFSRDAVTGFYLR